MCVRGGGGVLRGEQVKPWDVREGPLSPRTIDASPLHQKTNAQVLANLRFSQQTYYNEKKVHKVRKPYLHFILRILGWCLACGMHVPVWDTKTPRKNSEFPHNEEPGIYIPEKV